MSQDPPVPSLQDTALRLLAFWTERGCLLLPACDHAVPYATLVPDAFFHVLGPEPWRSACLQPLRRPLDARFGEHPYRLFRHLQLQVVLKPVPADVRSLYLESLQALGLELARHDVRFAEWRWEPVSVGARGTGWRVLVDGLGVTRITFLERLADRRLEPPSVEISYGLERLLMPLQQAPGAFELGWSAAGPDYGSLRRRDEDEHSRYLGEVADAGDLRDRLEALDRGAQRCLKAGLARPAYELAIRCLELIDGLEARGDLSTRERSGRLDRLRLRVAAAAELDQRKQKPAARRRPARRAAAGAKKKTRAKAAKRPAGKKRAPAAGRKKGAPAAGGKKPAPAAGRKKRAPAAGRKKAAPAAGRKKRAPAAGRKDRPQSRRPAAPGGKGEK